MKNGEYLYKKIGEVSEKYVDEAENYASGRSKTDTETTTGIIKHHEKRRRVIPAAVAACFAVGMISLPFILGRQSENYSSSDLPAETAEQSDTSEITDTYPVSEGNDIITDEKDDLKKAGSSCIYEMNKQTNEYELIYRYKPDNSTETDDGFENPEIFSWALETAFDEIDEYFMDKYDLDSLSEGHSMFLQGGYDIYLTTDRDIQEHLDTAYADWYNFPKSLSDNGEQIQSGFVVMDYEGHILGIEGKIGEKTASLEWNNATDAHRQPGSAIKPVTAYGYAVENDLLTYSSSCYDEALPEGTVTENESWPLNYDGAPSKGYYPLWYFFKQSINTLPAQILYSCGIDNVFDFATQKLHLDLEPEDADYAALALGSTYTGPSTVNLANAYMPYGNGGKYYKASIISRCIDRSTGEMIIDNENREGEQVISEETAYIMNKLLSRVITDGTGTAAELKNTQMAGKTGTSENWRDISFVGMTPDYLSAVWCGYPTGDNPRAIEMANSARIWYNIFGTYADINASGKTFPECETVSHEEYCVATGKRASEKCSDNEKLDGYFKPGDPYCDGNH